MTDPITPIEVGTHRNVTYLITSSGCSEATLIDCHGPFDVLCELLTQRQLTLTRLVLTHTHWDHVFGLDELLGLMPAIELRVHPGERHRLTEQTLRYPHLRWLAEGDRIVLSPSDQAAVLTVWHTPGHSPGECCFLLNRGNNTPVLFTGDTLFVGDCGRTDLEGGSNAELFASLQRIKSLPDSTQIYPGHRYHPLLSRTLAEERRANACLQAKSVEELAAQA